MSLYTLKVVRASKLRAMDANGFSDPFVEVPTFKGKNKCTKVVQRNLNPVWNEVFLVKGPLVQCGVYDEDLVLENDLIGYANLDLPSLADGKEHDIRLVGPDSKRTIDGKLIGHLFVVVVSGDALPAEAKKEGSVLGSILGGGAISAALSSRN
ncbi:hypothetical protein Pelo_11581 [Pelomyxa schiedti]|nr:hypothetical protein Pelo_11581 [Pelomyxa schiedti]